MSERADLASAIDRRDKLYRQASLRWGNDAQLAKAAEECSEFAAVCNRSINGQADMEQFLEELVDAQIMLDQMKTHITDDAFETAMDDALDDLERRLNP